MTVPMSVRKLSRPNDSWHRLPDVRAWTVSKDHKREGCETRPARKHEPEHTPKQAHAFHFVIAGRSLSAWEDPHSSRATAALELKIASSRQVLDLRIDPEDPTSPAYSEDTWARAVEFLRQAAKVSWDFSGKRLQVPEILPGPHGSIDLHWDARKFELLINIPAEVEQAASFYGDDRGTSTFKGTFAQGHLQSSIILWLNQQT